jgi:hypothetical protein
MTSTLFRCCIFVAAGALLAGCASLFAPNCQKFEQSRKDTDYATHYAFSDSDSKKKAAEFKSLGKAPAAAPLYRIRLNTADVQPCTHLKLTKELFVQRNPGHGDVIEETREFFSGGGKLIATKKEVITDQLPATGYYSTTVPLPIPESAPPGKYRLASRLTIKPKGNAREMLVLARASADFSIAPLKKK